VKATLHSPDPQGNKFHAGNLHTKAYINWLTLTALNTSKDSLQQQSTKGHTPFVTNSRLVKGGISITIDRQSHQRTLRNQLYNTIFLIQKQLTSNKSCA
jgi:hypothetical protein